MSILSKLIDKRIAAYQKGLISTHYDEVEIMHRKMRGWRHDYLSHIQAMKSHAALGDMEAVIGYLDALDADLKTVDAAVKTGNKMADAILNSKISLARSKNVAVTADANIAVELSTSQLDLCIVIGNLMDNAIEACMKLPEESRVIRIYMEMKVTQLYISFTNSTASGKKHKVNGRFLSTKGRGHGFGLARIDDIVERCGGYISRNSEDGAFTTEIMLPQAK
jgi:sensor histidine kinase regulating citrate/malate metabolism